VEKIFEAEYMERRQTVLIPMKKASYTDIGWTSLICIKMTYAPNLRGVKITVQTSIMTDEK
jgi:hypothetical protein